VFDYSRGQTTCTLYSASSSAEVILRAS
jgi:hypothetical protein